MWLFPVIYDHKEQRAYVANIWGFTTKEDSEAFGAKFCTNREYQIPEGEQAPRYSYLVSLLASSYMDAFRKLKKMMESKNE